MPATVLSLVAATFFAGANIALHRGSRTAPTSAAVLISVFAGVPFFLVVAAGSGELQAVPWSAAGLFAAAGLVHFVAGRTLIYGAIGLLGPSRAAIFASLAPVFSLVMAVALLGESLAFLAVVGSILTITGPVLATKRPAPIEGFEPGPDLGRGMAMGVFGALCWGVSPVIIASALDRADVPLMGTLLSYSAAAVVLAMRLRLTVGTRPFRTLDRNAVVWFGAAALCTNLAQLTLYLALGKGDVSLVVVLMQLTPILTAGASYALDRKLERLTAGVIVGGALAVVGATLVVAVA